MIIDTDKIKDLLNNKEVSTSELARYMGVTRQAIDRIRKQSGTSQERFNNMRLETAMRFQAFIDDKEY